MTSLTTPKPAGTTTLPLTALDRCERCGAQAYQRFEHDALGGFLFCAHHGREHMDALTSKGFRLTVDDTHLLAPANRQQGAAH